MAPISVRRTGCRSLLALLSAVALVAWWSSPAHAATGDLDPAFSGDGVATVATAGAAWNDAAGLAVVGAGADRRLFVAARTAEGVVLARTLLDGTLDTSFATGGVLKTPLRGSVFMAVDTADRLVLAAGDGPDVLVLRYTTAGVLADSVRIPAAAGVRWFAPAGVAVAPDGTLLVAGSAYAVTGLARFARVVRVPVGGAPAIADAAPADTDVFVTGLAVDSAGRALVSGAAKDARSRATDTFVARFTAGSAFAVEWTAVTVVAKGDDQASAITVDASGRPVAVGFSQNGRRIAEVLRFTSAGTLDARTTVQLTGNDAARAVVADGDDVVIAGESRVGSKRTATFDLLAARVSSTGTVTWARTAPVGTGDDLGYAVAVDGGTAIVGGVARPVGSGAGGTTALARVDSSTAQARTLALSQAADHAAGVTSFAGDAVVAGVSEDAASMTPVVARLSANGTVAWQRSVPLPTGWAWRWLAGLAATHDTIVVAGTASTGSHDDMVAVGLDPATGSVDPDFGVQSGYTAVDFGTAKPSRPTHDVAGAVAVGGGRIAVGGRAGERLAVATLSTAGVPEWTTAVDATPGTDYVTGIAFLGGTPVAVAHTEENVTGGTHWDVLLLRFDGSGAVVSQTRVDVNGAGKQDVAGGVAVSGGAVFATATTYGSGGGTSASLLRFDGTGVLVDTAPLPADAASGVAVDGSGRVVVAGERDTGSGTDAAVLRFTAAGAFDTAFSADGWTTFGSPFGSAAVVGVAVAGNRLYVGGSDGGDLFVAAVDGT